MKSGLSVPEDSIRPELYEDLIDAFQIFVELTASRSYSAFGHPLGIRATEIESTLNLYDIRQGRDELTKLIRSLDAAWIEWTQSKP